MVIDNPPAIIGEITPAMQREIGCAGLWVQWNDAVGGNDLKRNEEVYRSYMDRCIEGQPVAIFTRIKR